VEVKLTEYGTASLLPIMSNEDERSAALARRLQQGDYDEGAKATLLSSLLLQVYSFLE
jgi:hypothetical protein